MRKAPFSALAAWTIQRLTAVYLLACFIGLLVYFLFFPPQSYEAWRTAASAKVIFVPASAFLLALFVHAWTGLRDVLLDYAKPLPLRVALLTVLAIGWSGLFIWALAVLFKAGG